MRTKTVTCSTHGSGEAIFVCDHLRASLRDNRRCGLFQWHDENGNVCAVCKDCAERAEKSGSGPSHVPLHFNVATLCPKCFEPIRRLNDGGVLYL